MSTDHNLIEEKEEQKRNRTEALLVTSESAAVLVCVFPAELLFIVSRQPSLEDWSGMLTLALFEYRNAWLGVIRLSRYI